MHISESSISESSIKIWHFDNWIVKLFSVDSVEHLLRLADEYQINGILDMRTSFHKNKAKQSPMPWKSFFLLSNTAWMTKYVKTVAVY